MLSCKEATHLMSEAQDRELAAGERLQLRMHLLICRGCRGFRAQIDFLRGACRHYLKRLGDDEENRPPR